MKNKFLDKNRNILLIILIASSLVIRLVYLDYSRFENEMVRDITLSEKILNKEPVLHGVLGSLREDTTQQSFGPLYYYSIAFSLIFTKNPYYHALMPYLLVILLNVFSIFILFKLCKDFFNLRIAFIASALYAFSPWVITHVSNVLTTPNFLPPIIILFIYCMFRFIVKNEDIFLTCGIILIALATQFHLSSIMLAPILISYLVIKKRFKMKYLVYGILVALLLYVPYLYYNISTGDLYSLFSFLLNRYESTFLATLIESLGIPVMYLTPYSGKYLLGNVSFDPLISNLIIIFTGIIVLLFGLSIINILKEAVKKDGLKARILLVWLIIPILFAVIASKNVSPHYFIILLPSQFIILGIYLNKLIEKSKLSILLPVAIVLTNIIFIILFYNLVSENNGTSGIFGVPYKTKFELISFIKKDSQDPNPVINYFTYEKRDLNLLFNRLELKPHINVISNAEEFKEGYLILDRFSFYSQDKSISEEEINRLGVNPVKIGNFEIYRK